MHPDSLSGETTRDIYEISPRFRLTMENRVVRLEQDAVEDERTLAVLDHPGHIRRHIRLIAVQRAEALRLRLFLDKARTRTPWPLIALEKQ